VTELISFLGFCNYYHVFCPIFRVFQRSCQDVAEGRAILPTEFGLKVFSDLKKFLNAPPVWEFSGIDGNLMLGCDASKTGCSAILQQEQDGHFVNCAFVFGLKHFRPYLQGDEKIGTFLYDLTHQILTDFQLYSLSESGLHLQ